MCKLCSSYDAVCENKKCSPWWPEPVIAIKMVNGIIYACQLWSCFYLDMWLYQLSSHCCAATEAILCAFVCTCTQMHGFYSPVMAVTAPAEEFSKGATIRLLSDRLSFSSRCGSTKSSHHPYNVPFFLFTLLSVPCFFIPRLSCSCPLHWKGFFSFHALSPSPTSLPSINQSLHGNAKILITGALRSHNTAESQLQLELLLFSLWVGGSYPGFLFLILILLMVLFCY